MLLCAACEPTLSGLVKEHRGPAEAFLADVEAVHGQLATAPAEVGAFKLEPSQALIPYRNVVVVAEQDMKRLLEASQDVGYSAHVRPLSESDLLRLVRELRDEPRRGGGARGPGTKTEMDAFKRAVTWFPGVRYVAVARTDAASDARVDGARFQPARFQGHVVVWDLEARGWIGRVPVEIVDTRVTTSVAAGVSDETAAREINQPVVFALSRAMRDALETGEAVRVDVKDKP